MDYSIHREKTTTLVKSDPAQAIDPYQQLVRLTASIRSCIYDAIAEAQFQGLMSHLDYTSNKLYQELFNVMSRYEAAAAPSPA